MSTAQTEAVALGVLAVFWLTVFLLALRLRMRTGTTNGWLYAAPMLVVVTLVMVAVTGRGTVLRGW